MGPLNFWKPPPGVSGRGLPKVALSRLEVRIGLEDFLLLGGGLRHLELASLKSGCHRVQY